MIIPEPILKVDRITRTFGGLTAVDGVSLTIAAGEVFGVVGPNGAGKTALLNCIAGVYPAESGTIYFEGRSIAKLRPHQISRLGIGRSFQSTEHFKQFTALDYLLLGRMSRQETSLILTSISHPRVRRSERIERDEGRAMLETLGLAMYADKRLAALPYGIQKRIDIARALAGLPHLVLLDEPTSGISSDERPEMDAMMTRLRTLDVTMLVVDHDVGFISRCCGRVMVMNAGRELGTGLPGEVLERPEVREIYFGSGARLATDSRANPFA